MDTRQQAEHICRIVEHYVTVIRHQKGYEDSLKLMLDKVEVILQEIYEEGFSDCSTQMSWSR